MNFGILGCGIVGLTTALELQREFPNSQVSIIADLFNEETTSYVAAGIFRPGQNFAGPTNELTERWIKDAYNHWDDIRRSSEASLAGVTQLSGYIFSKNRSVVRNNFLEKILPIYRQTTEDELKLCRGDWKYGSFFTTILADNKLFLSYATKKFRAAGGKINRRHINTFADVIPIYDVLINCAGLGAKVLCKDYRLVPMRGQCLKVNAPWIKTAFYGDYDTYVIPGFETVTLGGCRQYDSYNMDICKYDSMAIRERCCNMLPSLRKANVINEMVGLRPHRPIVRVEKEIINCTNANRVNIVHNYGHGGYGVTTAPGTAKHAVQLVKELLMSNSKL